MVENKIKKCNLVKIACKNFKEFYIRSTKAESKLPNKSDRVFATIKSMALKLSNSNAYKCWYFGFDKNGRSPLRQNVLTIIRKPSKEI